MLRRKKKKGIIESEPGRRRAGNDSAAEAESQKFRRGITMAGKREKSPEFSSERMIERKRHTRRKVVAGIFFGLLGLLVVAVGVFIYVSRPVEEEEVVVAEKVLSPTVPIVDENGAGEVSGRVNEFVARLEQDVKEYGMKVERVVLPLGMIREVDVYIEGRTEYYKMIISRSSAEQAEDMERMVRWIDGNGVMAGYVDLRVKGRAYYK